MTRAPRTSRSPGHAPDRPPGNQAGIQAGIQAPGQRDQRGAAATGAGAMAAGTVPGRRGRAAATSTEARDTPAAAKGLPGVAILFLLSLLPQIGFKIGPLLLKPYRVVLLILFVPLLLRLVSGAAGRMMAIDWLMIGACLWATLALIMNHPIGETIEPIGVVFIELLGAYMVARVCIRSAEDFRRVVRVLFWIILILLVFAALESVTRRPILLQLIGQGSTAVDAGIRFGLRRAQTVFAHPIHYGVFVSTGLGIVWYAFRPNADLGPRLACAFVIGLSTFLSLSTGALVAFNMQCVFIAYEAVMASNPRRWRLFVWMSLAMYIVLDMLSNRTPFHLLVDYATLSSGSAYNRILIWQFGTDNVLAHPIFGLGLNDWERPSWMSASVDNFWLLLTMQFGLPFILIFAGALLLIVSRVGRQELGDPIDRACRAGYLTTFGGVVIAGGTVHYWQAMFAFVLFIFGMGLWTITGGAKTGMVDPGQPDQRDRGGRRAAPGEQPAPRKRSIL